MSDNFDDFGDTPPSLDIRRLVASVAAELVITQRAISREVTQNLLSLIPELRIEPALDALLGASVEANIDAILHSISHGFTSEHFAPPAAALEYARTLAQRGVPVHALVRAYRLGHQQMTMAMTRAITEHQPVASLDAAEETSLRLFEYIDAVTQAVVEVYEAERDKWLASRNTIRLAELHSVLRGDPDGSGLTSIGSYRLDAWHRAGILWDRENAAVDLTALRARAETIARTLGPTSMTLVIPQDHRTIWFWTTISSSAIAPDPRSAITPLPDRLTLAFGAVHSGIDGFRASHEEAAAAKAIADLSAGNTSAIASIESDGWRMLSKYVNDLAGARLFVSATLGRLALDTPPSGRLRETLRIYLGNQRSNQTTAAKLGIHANSVKYRIAQGLALLPVELRTNRLDVEFALLLCQQFGRAVLTDSAAPAR